MHISTNCIQNLKVVLPVREGSERVQEKVLLPFDNVNLVEWKILQLKRVINSEDIVVSTNSEKLLKIATTHGVSIHERDEKYAVGNELPFSEVVEHIVSGIDAEHIAWVTCVTPLMSPQEYLEGFKKYFKAITQGYDSLVSFNLLKEYLWDDKGSLNYLANEKHVVSQNLPNVYRVTNGLYMASKKLMLEKKYFMGENPYRFQVSKLAGIDIDYYEDYEMAKALLPLYLENQKEESLI
ncbi:hypothetical protein ABE078_24255 [Priestia megaterium]